MFWNEVFTIHYSLPKSVEKMFIANFCRHQAYLRWQIRQQLLYAISNFEGCILENLLMKDIKGGSPFTKCELRDCKIRSLSISSISCCTRAYFLLHSCHWKKVQLTWTFFQLLASDDIKVNITQRMSTKIYPELDSLSGFWWKLQNLLWNYVKQKKKNSVVEKWYVLFQMREAVAHSEKFFKIGILKIP